MFWNAYPIVLIHPNRKSNGKKWLDIVQEMQNTLTPSFFWDLVFGIGMSF
jgi:hypothetical protein